MTSVSTGAARTAATLRIQAKAAVTAKIRAHPATPANDRKESRMDGRFHLAAGGLAGAATAAVAFQGGWVDTWTQAALLGGLCAGSALFPDLDTASRPQRWAARALVLTGGGLALAGAWRAAALLGLAGLLPLLTHHRGWTHRWWAALLAPLGALGLWHTVARAEGGGALGALAGQLAADGPAYLAMAGGYALHLMIDRMWPRRR
jgi:hypothetical protein